MIHPKNITPFNRFYNIIYLRTTLITILIFLLCASCQTRIKTPTDPTYHIEPLVSCIQTDNIDKYIEDLQIIDLSDTSIYVIPKKILLFGDFMIILSGNQVFEYTSNGQFLMRLGTSFDEHGRYMSIMDICLNQEENEVLCLTTHNHILRYSIPTGCFLGEIDSGINDISSECILPYKNGFALCVYNPRDPSNFTDNFYCLKIFNRNGRKIGECFLRDDFYIPFSFYSPSIQGANNEYFLSYSTRPGICYRFSSNGIEPWCDISFQDKNIPLKFAVHGSESPWNYYSQLITSHYYKCVFSYTRTEQTCSWCAWGDEESAWNFVYDFNSNKGIRWESKGRYQPIMNALASDSDYYYYLYNEPNLRCEQEIKDPLKRAVFKRTGYIVADDGSPAIFKVKYKF